MIDQFVSAYNERDLPTLRELVAEQSLDDPVTGAYRGDSTFAGIEDWAAASWEARDRMTLVGYGAFHPTKKGFTMLLTRRSSTLKAHGIDSVATTMSAVSHGCSIASLAVPGVVQAEHRPCAFYAEFAGVDDVAADEPKECRDGSGDYARVNHTAVSTGDHVLVWGGDRGGLFEWPDVAFDGLAFDPATETWSRIPEPHGPAFRSDVGVWTGRELLVAGGRTRGRGVVVAAYDPARADWRKIDFPTRAWAGFEGIWTGRELIVWGGPDHSEDPVRRGLAYNPSTGTWRKTSPAPIAGRWSHALTWTGTEMIVWGGSNAGSDLADGAAYDPATDTWRTIAPGPLSPRQWLPIVWTGREMFVWGGSSISRSRADGAAYDPALDTWRKLPRAPIAGRHYHSTTWTGSEVIVFGGYDYDHSFRDGAAYDPVTNSWRKLRAAPMSRRYLHTAIWTGHSLFVYGGTGESGHMARGDGGIYDPATNRWRRVVPETLSAGRSR